MLTKKQYDLLVFIHGRIQETGVSPSFDEMKDALDLKSKSGIHRLITALEERGYIRRLPNRARALEVTRLPENVAAARGQGQGHPGGFAGAGAFTGGLSGGSGFGGAGAPHLSVVPSDRGEASGLAALRGRMVDRPRADGGRHEGGRLEGGRFEGYGGRRRGGDEVEPAANDIPLIGRIAAGTPIEALQNSVGRIQAPPHMLAPNAEHFALEVRGDSMIDAGIHDGDTVIVRRQDSAQNGEIVVALVDGEEATLKRLRSKGGAIALEAANPAYETRVYGADRVQIQGRLVGLLRSY